jgi:hypothetical protein
MGAIMQGTTFALGLALGLGGAPPFPAHADTPDQTVTGLLDKCNGVRGDMGILYCDGFVFGIFTVMHVNGNSYDSNHMKIISDLPAVCFTKFVPTGAVVQAVRAFARIVPLQGAAKCGAGI